MPARTIRGKTDVKDSANLQRTMLAMAGMFDDPVATLRMSVGTTGSQSRITLQVVDRLRSDYPPASFNESGGKYRHRWVVAFWRATDEEFGAAVRLTFAPTWVKGKPLPLGIVAGGSFVANVYFGVTDESGMMEVTTFENIENVGWLHGVVLGVARGAQVASGGIVEQ